MAFIKNRRIWVVVSVVCVAIAAFAIADARHEPETNTTWKQSDAALGRPEGYQEQIEELTLTLTENGFAPAEFKPHSKKFLLSLDNRTQATELVLRMSRKDGAVIRELRVPGSAGSGDWSELFELPPGNYTFSEANHANWSCKVVIGKYAEGVR